MVGYIYTLSGSNGKPFYVGSTINPIDALANSRKTYGNNTKLTLIYELDIDMCFNCFKKLLDSYQYHYIMQYDTFLHGENTKLVKPALKVAIQPSSELNISADTKE